MDSQSNTDDLHLLRLDLFVWLFGSLLSFVDRSLDFAIGKTSFSLIFIPQGQSRVFFLEPVNSETRVTLSVSPLGHLVFVVTLLRVSDLLYWAEHSS